MMNLYDILGITPQATKGEIRKAYHKLVILNHPDKNSEPDAKQKFQDIQSAYEILSDDKKRQQYDCMTFEQKMHFYDLIKQYFVDIRPQYYHFYDLIINYIYSNDEKEFEKDINSFDIKKIFSRIVEKIKDNYEDEYIILDNEITVKITLKDKFESRFKTIKIKGIETQQIEEFLIPTYTNLFYINYDNKQVKINIICENDKMFSQVNDYDLLCIKKVSLYQYLYGGTIKIYHLSGDVINYEFKSCLEIKPIFILEGKGLPKLDPEDENFYGNLYIYLTIEGINSIEDDETSQKYSQVTEETIKLMFPPIID